MQARPTRTVFTHFWFLPEATRQRRRCRPQLHERLACHRRVTITSDGTTTQNFSMVGTSNLQEKTRRDASATVMASFTSDDCKNLNIALKNNGCANATGISATLTTTTEACTVIQGNSSYPDMAIDQQGTNSTPFQIQTASNFACGTEIGFDLNLSFPNGSKTVPVSVPTCVGGADQTIPPRRTDANDLTPG